MRSGLGLPLQKRRTNRRVSACNRGGSVSIRVIARPIFPDFRAFTGPRDFGAAISADDQTAGIHVRQIVAAWTAWRLCFVGDALPYG